MRKVELSQVYFIITRTCNLFCSHCIRSSGPMIKDTVSLEHAKLALDKIASLKQNPNILISGGEPTIHPHFLEIMNYACENFEHVTINTNGLNFNMLKKTIEAYPNVMIQISLDGDEKTHNLIRGKNTFARTLQNASTLAKMGAKIVLASTAGKGNINTFKTLDTQLTNQLFNLWTIQREVIYGRASSANALTTTQWNEFVEQTSDFKNQDRLSSLPMFALSSFIPSETDVDITKCNCSTGRAKLYINPDLTIFPCACLEEINMGDLKFDSIEEILQNIGGMKIEPNDESPCKQCPAFSKCQGGCPGASYHKYGSFGIGDPRCPAIQELIKVGDEDVK